MSCWNSRCHPLNPVVDPSSELIGITLVLLQWYNLYRRRYPPKDEVDIQDLIALGEKYVHILHICFIEHINHILHIMHILGTLNNV